MAFRYDRYDWSASARLRWGIAMGLMLLVLLGFPFWYYTTAFSLVEYINPWAGPEFLINYEGGFVRRGLIGEGLFLFGRATGINPLYIIYGFSFACFAAVVGLMLRFFRRKGWAWWIVFALPLCGYTGSIVRKDFMMYLLIMALVALAIGLTSGSPSAVDLRIPARGGSGWKSLLMYLIVAFAMLNHEGFIFFGMGAVCLYLWNVSRRRALAVGLGSTACLLFLLAAAAHGDESIVAAIYDSLDSLGTLPERPDVGAIDALQWKTEATFQKHLNLAFRSPYAGVNNTTVLSWVIGVGGWLARILLVYYMMINLPAVFTHGKTEKERIATRDAIGGLLILIWLTMLPMFTVLCCDRARVTQFWMMGAYIPAMMLPRSQATAILPRRISRAICIFNSMLTRILPPRPWVLVFLYVLFLLSPIITTVRGLLGLIPA